MQVYQHPQFEDVRRTVENDKDGARWREQGWKRVSKDKAPDTMQGPTTVVVGATAADTPPGGQPVD